MFSDVPASNVKPPGQMGKRKAFIHRADMCNTITRINDNTSEKTWNMSQISVLFWTAWLVQIMDTILGLSRAPGPSQNLTLTLNEPKKLTLTLILTSILNLTQTKPKPTCTPSETI